MPPEHFERMGEALMHRRRLHMRYLTRACGEVGEHEVSPQRLVHYRNTWYPDAWCHSRERLLRFALDAVQEARVLEAGAKDVARRQVQAEMDTGYGSYAGGTRQVATLRFSPQAAPWASREEWHPEQQGRFLDDGSWQLSLPYMNETELVTDLLRQGEQVQVAGARQPAPGGAAVAGGGAGGVWLSVAFGLLRKLSDRAPSIFSPCARPAPRA